MDFTLTETQTELRALADRIIGDHAAVERIRDVERAGAAGGDGIDRELWGALAQAGILRAFAEPDGGVGDGGAGDDAAADDAAVGVLEAALVCEAHGRHVAPVPLWPAVAALLALREAGEAAADVAAVREAVAAGDDLVTVALAEVGQTAPGPGSTAADGVGLLTGAKLAVPAAPLARWALVPVGRPAPALHLVDLTAEGVAVDRVITTDRSVAGHLRLTGAPSVRLGGPDLVERLLAVATVVVCGTQVGVCAEAVRRTGEYLNAREQFGRPISAFQGPVLRIADAHIDTEAMRVTTLQAAWRLATGRPAAEAVATAKWWAAEAGHRVVHSGQHLHGGIGADVDYPIHRYFLWGKQLVDTLGGASAQAAELGRLLAAQARTGEEAA
ncbi:MAG TPA: acyl-CoA dehydrogenase family protein [Acidimicrobiales bacterium]